MLKCLAELKQMNDELSSLLEFTPNFSYIMLLFLISFEAVVVHDVSPS